MVAATTADDDDDDDADEDDEDDADDGGSVMKMTVKMLWFMLKTEDDHGDYG